MTETAHAPATYDTIQQRLRAITPGEQWLVAAHKKPDGDATGSLVAGALLLRALGADVTLYAPDGPVQGFESLIEGLPVVTDKPETVERLLMVDCARAWAAGFDDDIFETADVVILDHHAQDPVCAHHLVDLRAASATMVIWQIAQELDDDATLSFGSRPVVVEPAYRSLAFATACYAGLVTDTGRFRHTNTTARAMQMAADMLRCGVDVLAINALTQLPVPASVQIAIAKTVASLQLRSGGRIAAAVMSTDGLTNADVNAVKGAVNYQLAAIEGVVMTVLIRPEIELAGDELSVSLRCNHPAGWNMKELAGAYGGGGHIPASGLRYAFTDEIDVAANRLLDEIETRIEQSYGG